MDCCSIRLAATALACVGSWIAAPVAFGVEQSRALFENLTSEQSTTQLQNPGVVSFSGFLSTPSGTAPGDGTARLQEASFGQSFSQWFPSATYAGTITTGVDAALYPDTSVFTTRSGISASGKPFRYKWLLYDGTGTDVTAFDVTSLSEWFTTADRTAIADQLAILKEAVAASPLDTGLRNALLDLYYDLSVAEMQAIKPRLAKLATLRLGLETLPSGQFIIDVEIETYQEIVDGLEDAIAQYRSLLTEPFDGIDPSSFNPSEPFGTPMGRYIFIKEQVRRDTEPAEYANSAGILEVPQPDLTGSGEPITPGTLFTGGHKDLNVLLQIIGQRKKYLASLARLRGVRKADGDLAMARQCLEEASGTDDTDLQIIKSWFPDLFPPDLGALSPSEQAEVRTRLTDSGVLASLAVIEAGRIDLIAAAPFLNGVNNLLGFDPEFLLLVQDMSGQNPPKESFDVLRDMLTGDNQPLAVALEKLGTITPPTGARGAYENFRQKVDQTANDIDNANQALANRFVEITGFDPGTGFNLPDPNPMPGSELDGVLETIAALEARLVERAFITEELDSQFSEGANGAKSGVAVDTLAAALEKEQALLDAGQKYKNDTKSLYKDMITARATQVGSQASYDTLVNTINTPTETVVFSAGTTAAVNLVAGAINTGIQIHNEKLIGRREQLIDYAGIDFAVTTETVDAALVVNQARQELSAIKREQISNNLENAADEAALGQAHAQKSALQSELARIITQRDDDVAMIRKKSYADPLHYHRAESALLDADASFATAQRWMFYALQALNYKWHGKFASETGGKTYDSSTVFKARNAGELDDLLTEMVAWDGERVTQTSTSPQIITRISLLNDVLARNPNRYDPIDPSDPGTRADDTLDPSPQILPTLSKLEYFRNVLRNKYSDGSGNLRIPFSTAFRSAVQEQVDGNFFRGASYDEDGNIDPALGPGFWREKIEYISVNIIADNAAGAPASLNGGITYGGTTYFHTRVPPRSDRSVAGLAIDDAPGELLVAPFRYWVSPDFSLNFIPENKQTPSIAVNYNSGPLANPEANLTRAFAGRSIAASGWQLSVNRDNIGGFRVEIDNIEDIEIIIAYRHSDRVSPPQ